VSGVCFVRVGIEEEPGSAGRDEDPTPGSDGFGTPEPEFPQEDFSVYVPPKTQLLFSDGAPVARLEPTIQLVAVPLALFALCDWIIYDRIHTFRGYTGAPPHSLLVLVLVLTVGLAAAPYFFSSSYFAELYDDRLVVRQGSQEWTARLEDISSITHPFRLPSLSGADSVPSVKGKGAGMDLVYGYRVITTYGSMFRIPPFPGQDKFVELVLHRRDLQLAARPPIVRGTIHDPPPNP
jgi:hypothetical protein